MTRLIPPWLKRTLAWLVAGSAALLAIIGAVRRDQRQQAEQKASDSYIKTRKAIDATNIHDDPAVLRERMHSRDPNQR